MIGSVTWLCPMGAAAFGAVGPFWVVLPAGAQ
jgi:hypothetical protein